jgi:hypothetical protein
VVVYPQANTVYTMTASDGTCVNTTTIGLATYSLPVISMAPSATVLCAGETVSFTISGADTYSYSNNPSTSPPITATNSAVQLTTTTSYAVTGTNQFSCSSTVAQVIVVNPLPNIAVSRTPTLVCVGGASSLNATSSFQSPAHTYTWTHGGFGSQSVVNPEVLSTYTVAGTNTITGCVNTQTVSVAVFHPSFTTTPDTAICLKGSINLQASGATQFTWQPINVVNVPFVNVSPTVTTIFTVSALSQTVNGLKCTSSQTIQVDIYNNPTVTATSQRSIVCRFESVELYASGAKTYTWVGINQQGDTAIVKPQMETTYTVMGTDIYGCRDTTTLLVRFSNCPGFEEHTGQLQVSVFPNPNNGVFTIKGTGEMRLELINELGQAVRTVQLTKTNAHTVHLEGLAPGIYFLHGRQGDAVLTEKIVVQN